MKRLSILGSTGSIGDSTLDLISRADAGEFQVVALTAHINVDKLAAQARQFEPDIVAIADPDKLPALKDALDGTGITCLGGTEGVAEAAQAPCDWTMAAIVGAAGLQPTLAAVRQGRSVALANKECLVCAGDYFMAEVARSGCTLLPVDSEHNAIFQCLPDSHAAAVSRLILTASGGPFRSKTREELTRVSPKEAVAHPNWDMGAKISVDSASLMNKGLELIEAHYLFGLPEDRIDVLVHPQSIIHSMVEYMDGSVLAQMGSPDMRIPIASTLAWPERMETPAARLNLLDIARLDFEAPDMERFPCLRLARESLQAGGGASCAMNAANEVAVAAFLSGEISFMDIPLCVETILNSGEIASCLRSDVDSLDAILNTDDTARRAALSWVKTRSAA